MKPEADIVEDPREPQYRKKAQLFLMAVVGLLAAVLLIDVFQRMGPREPVKSEKAADEQAEGPQAASDAQEFDRQFQDELRRRRARAPEPGMKETPEQILQRLRAQREAGLKPDPEKISPEQQLKDAKSPEEDWKKHERTRALRSRMAAYGKAQLMGAGQQRPEPPGVKPAAADAHPLIEQEAEVRRRLQALEGAKRELAAKPPPAIMLREAANEPPRDGEEAPVGQPASEQRPKPGQKLIATGTVISAVLDQMVMSDYVGSGYRFMIAQDVYDLDRQQILIPKGSRGVGKTLRINNVNEPIQARMGLTVNWVVLPNGKRISFEKHGILDQEGIGAVKDQVDYHFLAQFLGVAAYAVISSSTSYKGSGIANDTDFEGQVSQSMREQFSPLARKYLSIVPTITLRPGTPLKIFLEDDVYAFPWKSLDADFLPPRS